MLMIILSTLLFLTTDHATITTDPTEYKLLATNKTSSMEKEMNQAAAEGYRFEGTMGGETAGGGNEKDFAV